MATRVIRAHHGLLLLFSLLLSLQSACSSGQYITHSPLPSFPFLSVAFFFSLIELQTTTTTKDKKRQRKRVSHLLLFDSYFKIGINHFPLLIYHNCFKISVSFFIFFFLWCFQEPLWDFHMMQGKRGLNLLHLHPQKHYLSSTRTDSPLLSTESSSQTHNPSYIHCPNLLSLLICFWNSLTLKNHQKQML